MSTIRNLRFVLRELTAAAEVICKLPAPQRMHLDLVSLEVAVLKARNELDNLANAGKPTPKEDPIDDITPEDVLGQLFALIRVKGGGGSGYPPALLCQSEEARAATRAEGAKEVERMRDTERYLRARRTGSDGMPPNPRAFFFEG